MKLEKVTIDRFLYSIKSSPIKSTVGSQLIYESITGLRDLGLKDVDFVAEAYLHVVKALKEHTSNGTYISDSESRKAYKSTFVCLDGECGTYHAGNLGNPSGGKHAFKGVTYRGLVEMAQDENVPISELAESMCELESNNQNDFSEKEQVYCETKAGIIEIFDEKSIDNIVFDVNGNLPSTVRVEHNKRFKINIPGREGLRKGHILYSDYMEGEFVPSYHGADFKQNVHLE